MTFPFRSVIDVNFPSLSYSSLMPFFLYVTDYISTKEIITIDGKFDDWSKIDKLSDSLNDMSENNNINIISYKITSDDNGIYIYFQVKDEVLKGTTDNEDPLVIGEDTVYVTAWKALTSPCPAPSTAMGVQLLSIAHRTSSLTVPLPLSSSTTLKTRAAIPETWAPADEVPVL